jgi:hypothetical protein
MGRGKKMHGMMGGLGDGSEFKILDQVASVIGALAFLGCVVIGFWAVIALIFGLPTPQDTFGVRRVKNCTNYVQIGSETVDCSKIVESRDRDNYIPGNGPGNNGPGNNEPGNNGPNNGERGSSCETNGECDNGLVCNNGMCEGTSQ